MIPDRQLTPHFKLSEFLVHEPVEPSEKILKNIIILAGRLERLRMEFGRPIIITSGYRSKIHNLRVGGTQYSYHLLGLAADIQVAGMDPKEIYKKLEGWMGGVGLYPFHVHVDVRPYKARWKSK